MTAIKCATVAGAELLGLSATVGSIEKGKLADIVAVSGNPITDIKMMKEIVFVMKEGKVYKQQSQRL
jgi:imidazolonepropionase-like amidohydrolase